MAQYPPESSITKDVIYRMLTNKARNRVKLLHLEQQQVSDKMNWLDLVMIIKGVNDDPSTRLRRLIRIKVRLVLAELRVAQTTI